MGSYAEYVVDHRLFLFRDGEPFDELTRTRPWTFPDITKA
jgi:hypothetical protein